MRRGDGRRLLAGVAAAGFVVLTITGTAPTGLAGAAGTTTTTAASTAPALPVTLDGEGSYDVDSEILDWQNALYGTGKTGKINLNYLEEGDAAGRADLLTGTVDYAISGVPYSASELAGYKGGAAGIIAAPVMESAAGVLLNPPSGGFYAINGTSGNDSPVYTGEVREPAENVVAQVLHYTQTAEANPPGSPYDPAGTTATNYGEWDNPNIVSDFDSSWLSANYAPSQGDVFVPAQSAPEQVLQSQPNEQNLYFQEWAADEAPSVWDGLQNTLDPHPYPGSPWEPAEQPQPTLEVAERPGLIETLGLLESGQTTGDYNPAGVVATVPPSGLDTGVAQIESNYKACVAAKQTNCIPPGGPGQGLEWVYLQNANGDWTAPTPAAIEAGINATPNTAAPTATNGLTPLYAADNKVPGAYPLTYVDYLYAPAKGLSIAKTEALATTIRYLATDGQTGLPAHGDAQLNPTLVSQALAAANQLVESDCPAAGGTVVSSATPSPDAPNLPEMDALGKVDHCEQPAVTPPPTTTTTGAASTTTVAATTTTTAAAATTTTTTTAPASGGSGAPAASAGTGGGSSPASTAPPAAGGGPPSSGSGHAARGSTATTSPPASASHGAPTPRSVRIEAVSASALPLAVTSGNTAGLDKVAALLIGVGVFLLLRRRPAAWIRKVLGS